jgi:hypothetical protein
VSPELIQALSGRAVTQAGQRTVPHIVARTGMADLDQALTLYKNSDR